MFIFYHPSTLKIMGASDKNPDSLCFPYVEIEGDHGSLDAFAIEIKDDIPTVKVVNGYME